MRHLFFLIGILLIASLCLEAQRHDYPDKMLEIGSGAVYIDDLFTGQQGDPTNSREHQFSEEDVVFYFYEYFGEELNLSHFRQQLPEKARDMIGDKVTIVPPKVFSAFENKAYAAALLKNKKTSTYFITFLLVADYGSNRPIYFSDNNANLDFTDENVPIIFGSAEERLKVTINPGDTKKEEIVYWLVNPNYQKNAPEKKTNENNSKSTVQKTTTSAIQQSTKVTLDFPKIPKVVPSVVKNGWVLSFHPRVSAGNIKYHYLEDVDTLTYTNDYLMHTTAFGIETGLKYQLNNFGLGLFGRVEKIASWTSEKERQLTEEFWTWDCYEKEITNWRGDVVDIIKECELVNHYTVLTNVDAFPTARYSLGFEMEYNIVLGKSVSIAPYAQAWYSSYSSNNVYMPRKADPEKNVTLVNRYGFGAGINFKVVANRRMNLYLKTGYRKNNFDPQGLFDPYYDIKKRMESYSFGLGIEYFFRDR